jgi:hypothetical protein
LPCCSSPFLFSRIHIKARAFGNNPPNRSNGKYKIHGRRQLDSEWIELKPDESVEKCAQKITEA